MPDLIKLLEQWGAVTTAPIPFAIAVAIASGLIWLAIGWSYSSVLAGKNAQIELQDRQLSDYREKLKGATPEEAKAKIDSLERTLRMTVGQSWIPLSKSQIDDLASKLKQIQKSRAQIMYENALGRELAQSIFDAFKQAGWDQAWLSTGSGLGDGLVTGWSSRAVAVKEALESTAKLPVRPIDTEKEIPDLLIVGVGINS
ncbi:hypothetical protein Nham_1689 [Nitrobacter hamburgensis X14]|uniref:Uncharacterized protein n=1 Tax=Nitrobacter hamburgensis (strain DSM 10229 / NCIMB 13809 / X14) TaxID=323097 RepID=Q1QMP1_NITHX|nr:hypothetical protein [Nitrobacter hamburgensis]ABE62506.1 hypothetical protein Nham_1689 [Nitrobacter hamburgensis X14]